MGSNVNVNTFSFYALYRKWNASHISRVEWGVHTNTSAWYLDQGHTQTILNYKHLFLSVPVAAEICYGARRCCQANRWLLSPAQKLFLWNFCCLSLSFPAPPAVMLVAAGWTVFAMLAFVICHTLTFSFARFRSQQSNMSRLCTFWMIVQKRALTQVHKAQAALMKEIIHLEKSFINGR